VQQLYHIFKDSDYQLLSCFNSALSSFLQRLNLFSTVLAFPSPFLILLDSSKPSYEQDNFVDNGELCCRFLRFLSSQILWFDIAFAFRS
jgi:hypothetical protein